MPAVPGIRHLDAVEASQDRFKPGPELPEIRPELLDVIPAPGPIRDIPKGQGHKINRLPLGDDLEDRSEVIAEPFFTARRTSPVPAAETDLERVSAVGAVQRQEGMAVIGHARIPKDEKAYRLHS